jgi:superfamily I DNA/RNA helicase/mRNA-degrading endonuclease RelE of RelBE toxin-antitoxin system
MINKDMTMVLYKDYPAHCASLPKQIKAKVVDTTEEMLKNPESPGLHIEKIGDDGIYSARVNDDYRIIFAVPDNSHQMYMLYVGKHEDAYYFANHFKIGIHPEIGAVQLVEIAPKVMKTDAVTNKKLSRLAELTDAQMMNLGIPEEYWPQLREKVFKTGQLTGFKGLIPEESYDTLEFILEGSPVNEALEIWEAMKAPVVPVSVEKKEPLFRKYTAEELMSVGIPGENIDKIWNIRTEKELQIIAETLPLLAQQSLYALKAGETIDDIRKATFATAKQNQTENYGKALENPITLSEFAPVGSEVVLKAFMEYPNEKWRVFLHPTQTEIIRQEYNGPARIVGGAGTGKTVVIVHRAKRLAGECASRGKILVTTYGKTLKHDIEERIHKICSEQEIKRIEVCTVDKFTFDLTKKLLSRYVIYPGTAGLSTDEIWETALMKVADTGKLGVAFCIDEWRDVIQAQKITTEEEYMNARRIGRGKRIEKAIRVKFWEVSKVYRKLCEQKKCIDADLAQNLLADLIPKHPELKIYKSVIIDECQDLRAPALRMLRALAGEQRKNDMYLSGDSRQRIYGGRVSLSQCGIDIHSRSRILKLNYRTTEEIYNYAAQLQRNYQYDDLDGGTLSKDKSNCIFHGPAPYMRKYETREDEMQEMIFDIRKQISEAVLPSDLCIMVRSNRLVKSITKLLEENGIKTLIISNNQPDEKKIDGVRIMTMHRGKGMEFSYVYLPCLRDKDIPLKTDLKKVEGDKELYDELMLSEANLLAVAITRAKYQVWLSYSGKPSTLIQGYIS